MPPVGGQYQVIGISRERRRQVADVVGQGDCEEQIVGISGSTVGQASSDTVGLR